MLSYCVVHEFLLFWQQMKKTFIIIVTLFISVIAFPQINGNVTFAQNNNDKKINKKEKKIIKEIPKQQKPIQKKSKSEIKKKNKEKKKKKK